MNDGRDFAVTKETSSEKLDKARRQAALFGQEPATLWDLRIAMVGSQIIYVALGALILSIVL